MAVRSCIGCNTRHPQHTMIPLSLGAGGLCVVGRGGRSAWVCERQSCVSAVTTSAAPVCRAFRTRARPHPDLEQSIDAWRSARQISSLRAAHRSGLLIVSPSKDLNRNRDAVIWVVTADHQDERQSPTNKSSDIEALMPVMSIDSAMVSRITSRPGSTLLGIRPGRATRSLIDSLRRWHHLG